MGHEPVWVETKADYHRELAKRGLKQRETDHYNRDDRSPWATPSRFRAGIAIDRYLAQLAGQVHAKPVPIIRPRDEYSLLAADVAIVQALEEAVWATRYLLGIRCLLCLGTVVGDNSRASQVWSMTCPCRRLSYGDAGHDLSETSPSSGGGSHLGGG